MKPNFFFPPTFEIELLLREVFISKLHIKGKFYFSTVLSFPISHLIYFQISSSYTYIQQFSNFSDYDDIVTYTYFLIRVILKLNNGGDKEFEQLPNGQKRYFKDLISHRNEIQQDENKMFIFMGIYSYLQLCLDESDLLLNLPKNDVLEIFGKVFINR